MRVGRTPASGITEWGSSNGTTRGNDRVAPGLDVSLRAESDAVLATFAAVTGGVAQRGHGTVHASLGLLVATVTKARRAATGRGPREGSALTRGVKSFSLASFVRFTWNGDVDPEF